MQNDRNYPMLGSLFISKSHVGPKIQQKSRIWTLISLIIYDFCTNLRKNRCAHWGNDQFNSPFYARAPLQFFDGLIWRQWSFSHLYVEGYMVRLTQRSTTAEVPTICAPISTSTLLFFFHIFQPKNQNNTSSLSYFSYFFK